MSGGFRSIWRLARCVDAFACQTRMCLQAQAVGNAGTDGASCLYAWLRCASSAPAEAHALAYGPAGSGAAYDKPLLFSVSDHIDSAHTPRQVTPEDAADAASLSNGHQSTPPRFQVDQHVPLAQWLATMRRYGDEEGADITTGRLARNAEWLRTVVPADIHANPYAVLHALAELMARVQHNCWRRPLPPRIRKQVAALAPGPRGNEHPPLDANSGSALDHEQPVGTPAQVEPPLGALRPHLHPLDDAGIADAAADASVLRPPRSPQDTLPNTEPAAPTLPAHADAHQPDDAVPPPGAASSKHLSKWAPVPPPVSRRPYSGQRPSSSQPILSTRFLCAVGWSLQEHSALMRVWKSPAGSAARRLTLNAMLALAARTDLYSSTNELQRMADMQWLLGMTCERFWTELERQQVKVRDQLVATKLLHSAARAHMRSEGAVVSEPRLASLLAAALGGEASMTGINVACLVWALGQLQPSMDSVQRETLMRMAAAAANDMPAACVAMTVHGLARIQIMHPLLRSRLFHAVRRRWREMGLHDVTTLLTGATMLRWNLGWGEQKRLSGAVERVTADRQPAPAALLRLLRAFDRADLAPMHEAQLPLLRATAAAAPKLSLHDVLQVLHSRERMQAAPVGETWDAVAARVAALASRASPSQAATALCSMARMGAHPAEVPWIKLAAIAAEGQVPANCARTLWALAYAGTRGVADPQVVARALLGALACDKHETLVQLHTAFLVLDGLQQLPRSTSALQKLRRASLHAALASTATHRSKVTDADSAFRDKAEVYAEALRLALAGCQLDPPPTIKVSHPVGDDTRVIDVMLEHRLNYYALVPVSRFYRTYYLEDLGDEHDAKHQRRTYYSGRILLRNWLLEHWGFRVVAFSTDDVDDNNFPAHLLNLLYDQGFRAN